MFDIATSSLFEGLRRADREFVSVRSTGLRLRPGTSLARQGTRGRDCVLVCSGLVDVIRDGTVIAQVGTGALFGEMSLLPDFPSERTASGRTATECDVLVFSAREFSQVLDRFPEVAKRIEATARERAGAQA